MSKMFSSAMKPWDVASVFCGAGFAIVVPTLVPFDFMTAGLWCCGLRMATADRGPKPQNIITTVTRDRDTDRYRPEHGKRRGMFHVLFFLEYNRLKSVIFRVPHFVSRMFGDSVRISRVSELVLRVLLSTAAAHFTVATKL